MLSIVELFTSNSPPEGGVLPPLLGGSTTPLELDPFTGGFSILEKSQGLVYKI